jgi:hypothetical protein
MNENYEISRNVKTSQLRRVFQWPFWPLACFVVLFGLVWHYFVRMKARLARFLLGKLAWLTVSSYSLQYILYFYVLNLQF